MHWTQTFAFWETAFPHLRTMLHDSFLLPSGGMSLPIAHLIRSTVDLMFFLEYCRLLEGSMDPTGLHTTGQETLFHYTSTGPKICSFFHSCQWRFLNRFPYGFHVCDKRQLVNFLKKDSVSKALPISLGQSGSPDETGSRNSPVISKI